MPKNRFVTWLNSLFNHDPYRERKRIREAPKDEENPLARMIKKIGYALGGGSNRDDFVGPEFDLNQIEDAYNTDCYIRQALDRYIELMFKAGWKIRYQDPRVKEYLNKRLVMLQDAMGQPFSHFLKEISDDLVKYSNVFMVKARQDPTKMPNMPGVSIRPIGKNKPIAAYFRLPPQTMQIKTDEYGTIKKYKQVTGQDEKEFKPIDIIHIAYKRPAGKFFGVPFTIPVLDDIRLLRKLEDNVAKLVYRHLYPLFIYKIGLDKPGFEATDDEIEDMREEIQNMPIDGGLVVPERHEIDLLTTEENINADKYLEYFEKRVFTGLGVSQTIMGRADCYDEETQTLTDNGWKYYYEIGEGDKIATFNPDTQSMEYHEPIDGYDTHIYENRKEKMYHFKSKHIDIKVTGDHKMWIMTNRMPGKYNWRKEKAIDLYKGKYSNFYMLEGTNGSSDFIKNDYIEIPTKEYNCNNKDEHVKNIKFKALDFAEFLGYFISEGCLYTTEEHRKYPISISQKKNKTYYKILENLDNLGLKYNIRKDSRKDVYEITTYNKHLYYYLKKNAGTKCYNKRIPRDILKYNPNVLQSLLDALILGDGTKESDTHETYYTVNSNLADDVQELAIKLGYKAKVSETKQSKNAKGSKNIFRVLISHGCKNYRYFKPEYITEVDYEGAVYCYHVPNHLFYTRRNGKIAIHGNTSNRSTAENQSTEMRDKVRAVQTVCENYINHFVIRELLMEGGFDPVLNPDDQAIFEFNEIDTDLEIKRENHMIFKFEHNAWTFDEMREALGLDPDVDEGRLHNNMFETLTTSTDTDNRVNPQNSVKTDTKIINTYKYENRISSFNAELKNEVKEIINAYRNKLKNKETSKYEMTDLIELYLKKVGYYIELANKNAFYKGVSMAVSKLEKNKSTPSFDVVRNELRSKFLENSKDFKEMLYKLLDKDNYISPAINIQCDSIEKSVVTFLRKTVEKQFNLGQYKAFTLNGVDKVGYTADGSVEIINSKNKIPDKATYLQREGG
ncbi:MAG: LAGLIDADG family homing endonuclease [Halanaerobiales bacterium]